MSKELTITQLNLTLAWEQVTAAQHELATAIEQHEKEDINNTHDNIAAAEGRIEAASAILSDIKTNHTH